MYNLDIKYKQYTKLKMPQSTVTLSYKIFSAWEKKLSNLLKAMMENFVNKGLHQENKLSVCREVAT